MIAPVNRKLQNKNKAEEGDLISFTRDKIEFTGKVIAVYENSVCVEIESYQNHPQNFEALSRTVVSHKRYKAL